jgi:hypothetical protein
VIVDWMMEPIFENTVLTVALKAGIAATAATATRPAASAYSTRSCPRESFPNCFQIRFMFRASAAPVRRFRLERNIGPASAAIRSIAECRANVALVSA